MSVLVSMSSCPNCGAPISRGGDARYAICIFCNTSLTLAAGTGAGDPAFTAQAMAKEDVDRVKQLLVDGKREEAIALYASLAQVTRAEAEQAIENVFVSTYFDIVRHLPINAFGFVLYLGLIALGVGLAAWGAKHVGESTGYVVPVVIGVAFTLYRTYALIPHLRATVVSAFGARGRGRVVRSAVIREQRERDEFFIVVVFEVTPDDGSAVFVDQETLFSGSSSLAKLVPNNVVPVRFNGARSHVYPIRPVTVIG